MYVQCTLGCLQFNKNNDIFLFHSELDAYINSEKKILKGVFDLISGNFSREHKNKTFYYEKLAKSIFFLCFSLITFFGAIFHKKISLYFKSALKFSSFEPQIVQFQAKYFLVLQRRHLKTNICSLANYSLSDKKKDL